MNTEKIKFTLGLILISGLVIYSLGVNLDSFSDPEYLNNRLSASVDEVDINPSEQKEDSKYINEEYGYQFKLPSGWMVRENNLENIIVEKEDKKIFHFVKSNPYNLSVKRWVVRDMARKIITKEGRVEIGDKSYGQTELENFFYNILSKPEEEQVEAMSYLDYNSMQHLYLKDKEGNGGKQVIQLTSRKDNIGESFYVASNSSILIFTYGADFNEDIEEYRSTIKNIIKTIK